MMVWLLGVAVAIGQAGSTFRPFVEDPVALRAHERLVAKRKLMELVEGYGSNARMATTTRFTSKTLRQRLDKVDWPDRYAALDHDELWDLWRKGERFDLADAYTYCFIAHAALASPFYGGARSQMRPWPVAKIRRQFQRALTTAGTLDQGQREHLYFALVRSAAIAERWWSDIMMAVNARGDVIGNSAQEADSVVQWLMGVHVREIELGAVKAGIQRKRG